MPPSVEPEDKDQQPLQRLSVALETGSFDAVRDVLADMNAAEIAHLLESLPSEQREVVWDLVPPKVDGEVLAHVNDDVRAALIRDMEVHEIIAATEGLDTDDLADILPDLPDSASREVLRSMSEQDRHRLETVLSYGEDTAGGLMNIDTITVREDVILDVVLRYLRLRGKLPEMTDKLIVVDREDYFRGLLDIGDLVTRQADLRVADVMRSGGRLINVNMPAREVASLFEHHDLVSAPVVDDDNKLVGRITIDDVVDVIRDEGDHTLMGLTGLDEQDDMFAPVVVSARQRGVWLGINLLTALLASAVIGMFEATIQRVVALAVLMPIVASMGGIAGTQTLTLVIRGIALGQVGDTNAWRILGKEMAVGLLNGLAWALIVGVIAALWFEDTQIGFIIAAAIVVNLVVAGVAGATIPLLLRRLGADPALGGGVMVTTVTDVIGFMAFLGLAAAFIT